MFFFSSRRRHTIYIGDWSSDVCSSDLCNAYDELDFDAMVVETYEALRAYHGASQKLNTAPRHTILILDNNLHRSEERRVGKEYRYRWQTCDCMKASRIHNEKE